MCATHEVIYCAAHHCHSIAAIDTALVRQFAATLNRKGMSAASIQRSLSSIRSFFAYANQHLSEKVLAVNYNPADGVRVLDWLRSSRAAQQLSQVHFGPR